MFINDVQPTRCTRAMVLAMLVAWLQPALSSAQSRPLFQVEPTMNQGVPGLRDACLNPGQWPTGWERTDLFGNAVQFFAALSDPELAQCVSNVRSAGKSLVVAGWSLKGTGNCRSGPECWNALAPTFRRMRDLGADIEYFEIDEPLTTGQPTTFQNAVDQTVEWIRLARSEFPGVKIILQEAYPAQSPSTLANFYSSVHSGTITQTGFGIQFAQLDHDWNAGGNGLDVRAIQNSVRNSGIAFSVIFWGASEYVVGSRPPSPGIHVPELASLRSRSRPVRRDQLDGQSKSDGAGVVSARVVHKFGQRLCAKLPGVSFIAGPRFWAVPESGRVEDFARRPIHVDLSRRRQLGVVPRRYPSVAFRNQRHAGWARRDAG